MALAQKEDQEDQDDSLLDVVKASLGACKNDRARALTMAVGEVLANIRLNRSLVEQAVQEGIDSFLALAYKDQRKTALYERIGRVVDGARIRVTETMSRISDFPLPSGKSLRDGLRTDVMAAATHWLAQAKTMLDRGIWLRMIAKKMPNDETPVGKVFSDDQLQKMLAMARERTKKVGV
jgi:hypothetical protein